VLHASAVGLPSGAVAFVGEKGAGKSTAAGAFLARGYPLLTDDVLPVAGTEGGGDVLALPGPAALKLWPESARALGYAPRRLPRLHPAGTKRVLGAAPAETEGRPLRALYVLDVGEALAVEPVRGHLALVELLRHAYVPRFVPDLGATPAHFARCARVARAVPIFRLRRPPGLEKLPDLVAVVEAHVVGLPLSSAAATREAS
jgi:hypothetical protein